MLFIFNRYLHLLEAWQDLKPTPLMSSIAAFVLFSVFAMSLYHAIVRSISSRMVTLLLLVAISSHTIITTSMRANSPIPANQPVRQSIEYAACEFQQAIPGCPALAPAFRATSLALDCAPDPLPVFGWFANIPTSGFAQAQPIIDRYMSIFPHFLGQFRTLHPIPNWTAANDSACIDATRDLFCALLHPPCDETCQVLLPCAGQCLTWHQQCRVQLQDLRSLLPHRLTFNEDEQLTGQSLEFSRVADSLILALLQCAKGPLPPRFTYKHTQCENPRNWSSSLPVSRQAFARWVFNPGPSSNAIEIVNGAKAGEPEFMGTPCDRVANGSDSGAAATAVARVFCRSVRAFVADLNSFIVSDFYIRLV